MGPKLLRLLDKAEEMGFDQVVIDAPPILGIADALVLGNQLQNILFVVKAGSRAAPPSGMPCAACAPPGCCRWAWR